MIRSKIGISMGDPAGIGPEIIARACARLSASLNDRNCTLLIIGDCDSLRQFESISGPISTEQDAAISIFDTGPLQSKITPGQLSSEAGRQAYLAVEHAVRLAQRGEIDAIVTAPLNKQALNMAGYKYVGHTEMLADLTGTTDSVMMLAHGSFRVTHLTTHLPLSDVSKKLTPERLRHVIDTTVDALKSLGLERPRIAVAALNPHAGEGGIFGREDIDVSAPTIREYSERGDVVVVGPEPGDTVFVKMRGGQYDAVIAMYHDQGHVPTKLLGFQANPETGEWTSLSGVNVTLGLPILRCSVDHGTAFDIAGKGIANEGSMVEAIEYAIEMVRRRAN